ncbi:putative integrin alpha FG-GAP repeat-containing protein [Heterostelium album PN500]|uniref:Putative integrin alpha FG-GAP repeat-containing protein n=1 Tax=Heterostelium pallidum (strain ATCC 26659 / Pp 5 / PN500) TaxID=670386 RepID=D3B178_HETP5|nr:putative integrin alpha FG-GAP repeat-containing protein [Heterostelium album PN500]EFA85052.1 putative integrin alpha FG-GAP repeat-containing protein [Heterostelium album PN500]|eukprot:XP_020437162.1 putative integrin alpha FG-GAP repeat-containing protein [Heterostelium album PN500]
MKEDIKNILFNSIVRNKYLFNKIIDFVKYIHRSDSARYRRPLSDQQIVERCSLSEMLKHGRADLFCENIGRMLNFLTVDSVDYLLYYAVMSGSVKAVGSLLLKIPDVFNDLRMPEKKQKRLISYLIRSNHTEMIKLMLDRTHYYTIANQFLSSSLATYNVEMFKFIIAWRQQHEDNYENNNTTNREKNKTLSSLFNNDRYDPRNIQSYYNVESLYLLDESESAMEIIQLILDNHRFFNESTIGDIITYSFKTGNIKLIDYLLACSFRNCNQSKIAINYACKHGLNMVKLYIDKFLYDNTAISTSTIKMIIEQNNMELLKYMLDRYYRVPDPMLARHYDKPDSNEGLLMDRLTLQKALNLDTPEIAQYLLSIECLDKYPLPSTFRYQVKDINMSLLPLCDLSLIDTLLSTNNIVDCMLSDLYSNAASNNRLDIIQYFEDRKSTYSFEIDYSLGLMGATLSENKEIVVFILQHNQTYQFNFPVPSLLHSDSFNVDNYLEIAELIAITGNHLKFNSLDQIFRDGIVYRFPEIVKIFYILKDHNRVTRNVGNPILYAIESGRSLEFVKHLYSISGLEKGGTEGLAYVCARGDMPFVKYLVEEQNVQVSRHHIQSAVAHRHMEIATYLLDRYENASIYLFELTTSIFQTIINNNDLETFSMFARRIPVHDDLISSNPETIRFLHGIGKLHRDIINKLLKKRDQEFEAIRVSLELTKTREPITDFYSLRNAVKYNHNESLKLLDEHRLLKQSDIDLKLAIRYGHIKIIEHFQSFIQKNYWLQALVLSYDDEIMLSGCSSSEKEKEEENRMNADFFSDFWKPVFTKAPKFANSQLYTINDIGLQGYDGKIMAFGDFNADKYLDTFFVYSNRSTLQIFLWDVKEWRYEPSDVIITLDDGMTIDNVIPGDFTYDGLLDIVIQGGLYSKNVSDVPFLYLYKGDLDRVELPLKLAAAYDQVLALDCNGDLRIDLLGVDSKGARTLWINQENDYFTTYQQGSSQILQNISSPHSNSFVDLNGDCLADMFITSGSSKDDTLTGEIWLNDKSNGYNFDSRTFPLPRGAGQITFADFDGDGDLDMLYPVCWPPENCSEVNDLYLVYNSQKPVCASSLFPKANCRAQNALCQADPNFSFSNTTGADGTTLIIPKEAFGGYLFYFNLSVGISNIIHYGDYNIDGYPDIIVALYNPNNLSEPTHVELWENVGCNADICPKGQGGRTFVKATSGTDALTSIPYAYTASFIDYGENGIADIIVQSRYPNGSHSVQAVYNNFYNDAFFFKTLGLNGVCTTMCPGHVKFPDPKPYGVNFPGGTFKFIFSDMSGTTHIQIGAQLSQSAYMSLQTPYNFFGLGRTSNYIDQLFYGIPLNQTVHYNSWVGTIPNSQIVAIPYKPSNPTSWTLELFINPSGIFFWVMLAFIVVLIFFSGVSLFLWKREKKQDEKLKQEQAHLFSFNAL